jgi:hypothetical protein
MRRTRISRVAQLSQRALGSACLIIAALGLNGCFVDEPPPNARDVQPSTSPTPSPPIRSEAEAVTPVQSGKLILHFTVSDGTDPNECSKMNVKDIEVTLTNTRSGQIPARWRHQCEAFAMSLTLPPGTYTGSAVLLDHTHGPRTTRIDLDAFTVRSNETVEAHLGFPASSFLE